MMRVLRSRAFGILAACVAAASCLPAVAQEPDARTASGSASPRLQDVVVTAYRVPTLQREAADAVTTITREEIERRAAAGGVDLLRQVPGLQVDQLGGPGGLSSVYVRGSDPNHVLVLIDGVRVNDSTNARGGGFDMSNLDPGQIERIEVLRGAASSIYGADAMGGVINIVTRRGVPAAPSGEIGAGAGGHDYRTLHGRVSGGNDAVTFSLGASRRRDGSDRMGGELDLSVYTGAARFVFGPTARIDLDVRHSERDSSSFPEDSGGLRFAQIRELDRKHARDTSYSVRGRWDAAAAATVNAALTRYQRVESIDTPGVAPGIRSEFGIPSAVSRTDYERDTAQAGVVFHHEGGSEFALGAEFQREHGVNRTEFSLFGVPIPAEFDLQRDTRSGYAEFKWLAAEALILRAGLRRDSVDGIGAATSPSAGLHYDLRSIGGSIRASWSEGFKPPSFFALGLPVALSGNPDLRAEFSKGGAIGYEQRLAGGASKAALSVFRTRYTDLVTFDNRTNQLVNADTVDVRGAEVELDVKASASLSLRAHFTRLLTDVRDTDEPLRQRPGRRAGFQVFYTPGDAWQLSWSTEYVADVFDSSVPMGSLVLPTYLRSDAALGVRLRKWLRMAVALDNVFDKRNEAYVGFVSPGRRLRIEAVASF